MGFHGNAFAESVSFTRKWGVDWASLRIGPPAIWMAESPLMLLWSKRRMICTMCAGHTSRVGWQIAQQEFLKGLEYPQCSTECLRLLSLADQLEAKA